MKNLWVKKRPTGSGMGMFFGCFHRVEITASSDRALVYLFFFHFYRLN